jgi:hypothetical protein
MPDLSKRFRLYIDESGTHNYSSNDQIKSRYLGLTGLMISEEVNIRVLQPKLLEIKRLFTEDPDELPVLHREDIVNKSGLFSKLNEGSFERVFNQKFLGLLNGMEYSVCGVVLDKKSHLEKYGKSAFHPYSYCANVLLERYVYYLEESRGKGDVLAEARGKKEDHALKEEYNNFYENGTYFCGSGYIQQFLSSREMKIKPKSKMFAGLEFADLLSLATKLDILYSYERLPSLTDNFCKTIIESIQCKYRSSQTGKINGFGRKLIY